jgi:hypothetical protein
MKKQIKVTRSNFCNNCSFYLVNYLISLLRKKYDVIISNDNPDIVFFANQYVSTSNIDDFTGENAKVEDDFPNCKKIFITGEAVSDYNYYTGRSDRHFTIGKPGDLNNDRHLNISYFSIVSAWQLWDECKLFDTPFDWLIEPKNLDQILRNKKYFAAIVQQSTNDFRRQIFDKLNSIEQVRSCGGFETNTSDCDKASRGRTEADSYGNKVRFLSEHFFSLQIQSTNLDWFTQEKMIQAYAANTIPIFWGNSKILEDGFNPESFVNCHNFSSIDDVVEHVREIYHDKTKLHKMITAPTFIDNKLPKEFDEEKIIEFLDKVVNL